jgi:hypothetical protein
VEPELHPCGCDMAATLTEAVCGPLKERSVMSGKDEEQIRLLKLIAAPEIRRQKERRLWIGCLVFTFLGVIVSLVLIQVFWKVR